MKKVFKNLLVLAGLTATAAGLASCGFEDAERLTKTNLDLSNISFNTVTRNAGDNVGDITPISTSTGAAILPNNISNYVSGVTGYTVSYWDASNKNQLSGLPTEIGEYMCHLDLEYDENIYQVKKSDINILRCGFNIYNKVGINAEDVKFDDINIPFDNTEHAIYATYLNEKLDESIATGIQSVTYHYLTKAEYEEQVASGVNVISWKNEAPKEIGEYVANMTINTNYRWYVEDSIKSKICNVTIYNEIDAANIEIPDVYVIKGEQPNISTITTTLYAKGLAPVGYSYTVDGTETQGYPVAVGTYTIKVKTQIINASSTVKFKPTDNNTDDICYVQYHVLDKAETLDVGGFKQSTLADDLAYSSYYTIGKGITIGTSNNKEKADDIADVTLPANQINLTSADKITIHNTAKYKSITLYVLNNSNITSGATVSIGDTSTEFAANATNSKIQKVIVPLSDGDNELTFGQSVVIYKAELTNEEIATYNVTYDANGHGEAPAAIKSLAITKAMINTKLTAEGFTFGGWYTDAECTVAATAGMISADTTLYAKWTSESTLEKINYELDLTAATSTTDKAKVAAGELSSMITFTDGDMVYRYSSSKTPANYCVEVASGGKSFTVTIPEGHSNVVVTIGFASTGGDNYSAISVKDAENSVIAATSATGFVTTNQTNVYALKGTTAVNISYTLNAGTYTFTAVGDASPVIDGAVLKAQKTTADSSNNQRLVYSKDGVEYYYNKKVYNLDNTEADDQTLANYTAVMLEEDYKTARGFRIVTLTIVEE